MNFNSVQVIPAGADGVAQLHLSAKRGSLPPEFWSEFPAALGQLEGARALVVRGAGQDFSVGLDLARTGPAMAPLMGDEERVMDFIRPMQRAVDALAELEIPTVAAVTGWCIGGGLELACAADIRLCSDDARFSLPEVRLGMVADLGGLSRLPRLVGEGWTRHLALTADAVDARQAERMGLVTQVLQDAEALHERALALAAQLAQFPPLAVRGTKLELEDRLPHAQHLERAARFNANNLDPALLAGALKKEQK